MILQLNDNFWNIDNDGFYIRGDADNGYDLCKLEDVLGDDLEHHLDVVVYYSSFSFEDILVYYSNTFEEAL